MTQVAGFAGLDHPFVRTHPGLAILDDVVAVPHAAGGDRRADRYRLAATWCAAGPFLPLPWTLDLRMVDVAALVAGSSERLREAVAAAAGRIDVAVRVELLAEGEGPRGASGRAYLRSIKDRQGSHGLLLDDLMALAVDAGFTIARRSRGDNVASCLVGCGRDDAVSLEHAMRALSAGRRGARLTLAGPLPPFGAGVEAAARLGLVPRERAA